MKTLKNVSGEIKAFLRKLGARRVYNVDAARVYYGASSRRYRVLKTSKESDAISRQFLGKEEVRQLTALIYRTTDISEQKRFNMVYITYCVNGQSKAKKAFKYSNKKNFEKDYANWCMSEHLCYRIDWEI